MRSLRNKTVVITGASSGIGHAAALAFARRGSNIVLAARRVEMLEEAKAEVEDLGVKALVVPTDVTDLRQVQRLIDASIEHFGQIDVIVNNAGAGILGSFIETPIEDIKYLFDLNVLGVAAVMQAGLKTMERQGWGVVLNVSSVGGILTTPYMSVYNATKAALTALSESANAEYFGTPIKIVAFCPAMTTSEFGKSTKRFGKYQQWVDAGGKMKASSEWVADRLVKASLKPKPLIMLGWFSLPSLIIKLLTPPLYYRIIRLYKDRMEKENPEEQ
ncbi:MAG: SDR family NAD(P)-dependent oxidoreductase [Armatimonadota bacterium]